MKTPDLFTPVRLGALEAPNRIVMAPLTRRHAGPGRLPTALMAEYDAQRAAAGLIINEATALSQPGTGCPNSPGIYTDAQVAGWKGVTEAVHLAGGRIFLQLSASPMRGNTRIDRAEAHRQEPRVALDCRLCSARSVVVGRCGSHHRAHSRHLASPRTGSHGPKRATSLIASAFEAGHAGHIGSHIWNLEEFMNLLNPYWGCQAQWNC